MKTDSEFMKIIFLGTNGWYDTQTGNTPCVLIETKDCYVVLDAGYGFAKLRKYTKKNKPVYLFISHFHLDHICGLHTLPLFNFKQPMTILAGKNFKKLMKFYLNHPFTAPVKKLNFPVRLKEIKPGNHKQPIKFDCRELKHIDNTLGFRIYLDGKIIAYCSDTGPCENSVLLGKNADALIHECGFLPGETSAWGHTNPAEAAKIAKKAKPKQLLMTHFGADKYKTTASRKRAEQIAKKIFPNTQAGFDGLVINL